MCFAHQDSSYIDGFYLLTRIFYWLFSPINYNSLKKNMDRYDPPIYVTCNQLKISLKNLKNTQTSKHAKFIT